MTNRVTALWDVNESCNLHCQYCYHVMNGEAWSNIQQPLPHLHRTMESLRAGGVTRLYFVGGEPFLRKDLPEIVGEAKRLGFETAVTTNGTVGPRYRDASLMGLFDLVEVSLDSLDAGYMAEIRTVRRLEPILGAIMDLVGAGHRVQVLAVANKLNFGSLPDLVAWCLDSGVTRLKIQPLFLPTDNRNYARLTLSPQELHELRRLAGEIYVPHPGVQRYYDYVLECAEGGQRRHHCRAFSQFVYITAGGETRRCPSLPESVAAPGLVLDGPAWCDQMSLDCLCVYSLIEDFEFELKPKPPIP